MKPVLPDILVPGLRIVFCGSAVGSASARAGAYYAGPGNHFWPILHETGLTPRRLAPGEFHCLADFGLGLTDLCKVRAGADADLKPGDDDVPALVRKIARFQPSFLAFNGKRAARAFCAANPRTPAVSGYGLLPEGVGGTRLWVLPSTSGAARRWWDERPWHDLAKAAATKGPPT